VIVGRCAVSQDESFIARTQKTKGGWIYVPVNEKVTPPKKKGSSSTTLQEDLEEDPNLEKFYCRHAINSQRGIYYDFSWDILHRTALRAALEVPDNDEAALSWGTGPEWNIDASEGNKRAKKTTKPPPKKRTKLDIADEISEEEDSESDAPYKSESDEESDRDMDVDEDDEEEEGAGDEDEEDNLAFGTPSRSRKRKRGQAAPKTPRKSKGIIAQPTPHSKAALRNRKKLKKAATASPRKRKGNGFTIRPPALSFKTDFSRLPKDPWLRAMHVLHVGNRPDALPCRNTEYEKVLLSVGEMLEEGSGGCVCEHTCIVSGN